MRLRRLFWVLAVLGSTAGILIAMLFAAQQWYALRTALGVDQDVRLLVSVLRIPEALNLERAFVNPRLAAAAPATPEQFEPITRQIGMADDALAQARRIAVDNKADTAALQRLARTLLPLRAEALDAIARPLEARPQSLGVDFVPRMFAVQDEANAFATIVEHRINASSATVGKAVRLAHLAWDARDWSGRQTTVLIGDLIDHLPMEGAQAESLAMFAGKIDAIWLSLRAAAADVDRPAITAALAEAEHGFWDHGGEAYSTWVIPNHGRMLDLQPDAFVLSIMPILNTVLPLRDAALTQALEESGAEITNRRFHLALAVLLSVFVPTVVVLFFARHARLNRAREALRISVQAHAEKSSLLEATLESIDQGIIMVDASGHVRVWNACVLAKLDLPVALLAGHPHVSEVIAWQQRNRGAAKDWNFDDDMRHLIRPDGESRQPHVHERTQANGSILEIQTTPLPGGGIVRTYTDVTHVKHTELILREARDQAHDAVGAKSAFLATMSHEIRSPMSGLVGVLEVLREAPLDPEPLRMANMAHGSALILLAVLNDVLDFSKIEAGAMSIVPEPVLLRTLVDDLAQPHMLQAARKGVALSVCCDADMPRCVAVDPLRLRQVLNNLLSNAIKFTASGEIVLSVTVAGEESAPQLRFTVRDTGIGMSAEVTSRLFEPFMQADGSTTRDFGGTGLGLCICQRLAGLLDGTLTVTSRPGEGSEFTLLLPLVIASVPDPAALADFVHERASLAVGGRALVADDDATIRWLSQRQLEGLGWAVDVAENGEVALGMLLARPYELLLTDCHMPRMDGVALTRAVRAAADPPLRDMFIIGLTADVTEAQRGRCLDAGMTDVVTKPLSRAQLAALLSGLMGRDVGAGGAADAALAAWQPDERPAEPAVFDPSNYQDIFARGDREGAAWLTEYLAIGDQTIDELERLFTAGDDTAIGWATIASTAHRFAGASLTVGATRAGEAAKALEYVAESDDRTTLRTHQALVRTEFDAARHAIAAFIADPPLPGDERMVAALPSRQFSR